jgi:BMFP domain-containing protein YqiC
LLVRIAGGMAKKRRSAKPATVPRARRVDVTREEFDRLTALLVDAATALAALRHDLDIQFTRMAQMQNQLEQVERRVHHAADKV